MSVRMARLGDLVEIQGGGTPSKEIPDYWNGQIPWASVKDFKTTEIAETIDSITEQGVANSATNIIPAGKILVPTRMAVGKAAINKVPMAINQDLKALFPAANVNVRYLLHSLLANSRVLERQATGATVKGITLSVLKSLEIPLPPLDEQKRIAAILDKADQLRQKRRQAIAFLDNLTQSIFLEMFGDPVSNPKGWPVKELTDFEQFLTSGSRGWAKFYAEKGRPFIRIQNLRNGKLSTDDLIFVNAPDNAESRRTLVSGGDVLISITADLGRVAVVPPDLHGGANINQHIALLRPKGINSFYLASYLASDGGKKQFSALNRQGVKAGLNFTDVRGLKILTPPMDMQDKFEQLLISLEARHDQYLIGRDGSESLFASLQHRAFTGQL